MTKLRIQPSEHLVKIYRNVSSSEKSMSTSTVFTVIEIINIEIVFFLKHIHAFLKITVTRTLAETLKCFMWRKSCTNSLRFK